MALITGAATGIGRASALLSSRAGARVALADLRAPELARTAADVRAAGGEAAALVADLGRPDDCAAAVAGAVRAFGRLDVVLNNAGVGTMVVGGTVESIALEHWDLAQDVNVRAIYLVCRAAVPHMRAMAASYGRDGIRVNAICPGTIRTRLTADIVEREERALKEGHGIPLGRGGVSRTQRAFGGFPLPWYGCVASQWRAMSSRRVIQTPSCLPM